MNRFDEFCNLILEAYGKRMDISPDDGRPAPDRYNNPGGAYPSKKFEKYGMEGYGILKDPKTGSTHPIGRYPTLANGIAANIAHLKSMPIVGKTVGQARHYWVYGNFNGSKALTGLNSNQVITQELLNDPNWLAQWMRATAADEGFGNKGRKIDDASLNQAFAILKSNSNLDPSAQYASSDNSLPPSSNKTAQAASSTSSLQPPNDNTSTTEAEVSNETEETMTQKIMNVVNNTSLSNDEKIKQLTELGKETKIGGLAGNLLGNINKMISNIASGGFDKGSFAKNATSLVNQAKGFFQQNS